MNGRRPDSAGRAPRWPLLPWALALVLALLLIARTPFNADLGAFMPASPDARQQLLVEQIHSGAPSRTLLIGIEGGDAATRAEASRALAAAMRASGHFDQVHNGDQAGFAGFGEWLFAQRYLLSPAVTPERFQPEGLRQAIEESLSLLGTPAGAAIKPLLPRDPSGETQRIAESLIPARSPRSEHGLWVSRERPGGTPRALLMATTQATGADLDGQAVAIAGVQQAFAAQAANAASAPQPRADLVLRISGAPVFGIDSRARIEREVHRLALAGSVVMGLLLLLAFASLRPLLVAALPVASGVVAGIAAVAAGFGNVHGMTLGFGSALIGEAVDYAIYYLIQARRRPRGGGWREWLHSSWPTVRLGLLTSVCGFAALVFSGFPGLAQLGVFSIAGLLAAAATTRWVLPALMPEGARGSGWRAPLAAAARAAMRGLPRLRWPLLALGAAALAVLLWRSDLWRADLASLSPVPSAMLQLDEALRADLTSADSGTLVVVQGPDLQSTLQRAEDASARLEGLLDRGLIGGFDSATRLLPSLATQQRRLAALPDEAALAAALDQATRGGPLPATRLQPFLADVAAARQTQPFGIEALAGTPVAPIVDALLLRRPDGSAAALLPLQPSGRGLDAAAIEAALAQGGAVPGLQVMDIGRELNHLYQRYLQEAQLQALLGAAAVVVLMALWLRNGRRLLAVCQPLVLAVLITMGALALQGHKLGILHLVGLLLVVAVGSNYALFFDLLRHGPPEQEDDDTLASLLLANLTTVASFGLLATSSIPVLAAIGLVVAPGALLALVLAAVFAPARVAAPPAIADNAGP